MRVNGRTQHVAGWSGGLIERAEPDRATGTSLDGRLRAGENFVHGGTGRIAVRGGARAALTIAAGGVNELTGVFRWSPTGAVIVGHSAANSKHYAYALDAQGALALPAGTPTETGSRDDLDWNINTPVWPQGVELFETLFLCDTKDLARQSLVALKLTGGALVATTVVADLDGNASNSAIKPGGLAVYGSCLFAFGWEDEAVGQAPHIMRHSLLGQDPADAAGWDLDAYATIGAQGEPIRSAVPGQDILLVAKAGELFRVFGDAEALPGWQFQIQPVNASLRLGAVNAHALCYDSDRWWGVGRDGPWSFDGRVGTSLVGTRRARWGQVGDLSACFVESHARRGCVLFGFPEPASLVQGARASRLWVFDTQADRWAPDFTHPERFYMVRTVVEAGVAIDNIPDTLSWLSDPSHYEPTAFSMTFTPGDAAAQTEVWVQPAGGSFALQQTVPAGVAGFRVSGVSRGTMFTVKIRHRKGDALTEFGPDVMAYTQIAAPRVLASGLYGQLQLIIPDAGRTLAWDTVDAVLGNVSATAPGLVAGTYTLDYTSQGTPYGNTPHLTTRLELSANGQSSPTLTVRDARYLQFTAIQNGNNVGVTQQFDAGSYAANSITVLVMATVNDFLMANLFGGTSGSVPVVVQYRVFGASTWTSMPAVSVTRAAPAFEATIVGLVASQRYEVQAIVNAGVYGIIGQPTPGPVMCFTQIQPPTASIATVGPGTPVTNITVTPPGALAGFDTEIRSADGTFDALYSGVSTAATTYQSTAGQCGVADAYWVRARNTAWPVGYQHSAPVELAILNPCVIG